MSDNDEELKDFDGVAYTGNNPIAEKSFDDYFEEDSDNTDYGMIGQVAKGNEVDFVALSRTERIPQLDRIIRQLVSLGVVGAMFRWVGGTDNAETGFEQWIVHPEKANSIDSPDENAEKLLGVGQAAMEEAAYALSAVAKGGSWSGAGDGSYYGGHFAVDFVARRAAELSEGYWEEPYDEDEYEDDLE